MRLKLKVTAAVVVVAEQVPSLTVISSGVGSGDAAELAEAELPFLKAISSGVSGVGTAAVLTVTEQVLSFKAISSGVSGVGSGAAAELAEAEVVPFLKAISSGVTGVGAAAALAVAEQVPSLEAYYEGDPSGVGLCLERRTDVAVEPKEINKIIKGVVKIVRLKRRKSNTEDPEKTDKIRRSKHHKRVRLKRWKSGLEINKTKGGIYTRVVRLKRRKHGVDARYIKRSSGGKWRICLFRRNVHIGNFGGKCQNCF